MVIDIGAFVGRPRKHPYGQKYGQMGIIDANFSDVPMEDEKKPPGSTGVDTYPVLAEGESTKYLQAIIETERIREKADRNDIDSLYACLNEYLALCHRLDLHLTNMGLYRACGVDRATIDYWASGQKRKSQPEYAEFAVNVRNLCSEYREMIMVEGKLNPVTGIWWQKNYDHFEDRPAPFVEATNENESMTSAEIAEKYKDMPTE